MVEFGDGTSIDIHGKVDVVHNGDGWYVVGEGLLYPVEDEAEGRRLLHYVEEHGMFIAMKLFKSPKLRGRLAGNLGKEEYDAVMASISDSNNGNG